ncbi:MAG: PQQ-like beta-propeller repeat protein [Treponema sp.]|nr:PQQ-like beta-propeller repeat protein [Treponema sp.]
MKIKKFCFTVIFFSIFSLYAQNPLRTCDLTSQKPSWQAVIGGQAIAPVAETSYGFAVVSDGRLVCTCTSGGTVMWQKDTKARPTGKIQAWGDFLYYITNNSELNLMNPSGSVVWKTDTKFKITQKPVIGWDGRVFIQGKNNVACYGYGGRLKWNLELSDCDCLPLQTFPDGSLLVFFNKTYQGKSTGLRISPFGKELETITFAGTIVTASQCGQGVLMTFTDGSAGLCTVQNDTAISKWVVKDSRSSAPFKTIIAGKENSGLVKNDSTGTRALIIRNDSGKEVNYFLISRIELETVQATKSTENGFFICDTNNAEEFDADGTINWQAKLPSKKSWSYITYTNTNQILICMNNWVLNAFVMNQSVKSDSKTKIESKSYVKASNLNQRIDGVTYTTTPQERIDEILLAFTRGSCAEKEELMLSQLKEQTENYILELSNNSSFSHGKSTFYSANPIYTQTVFKAVEQSQSDIFASDLADLLLLESDTLMLNTLIMTAQNLAYDKEGRILGALEAIANQKNTANDTKKAVLICDATYSIVQFMGRPALYRQGKNILSHFLYPQYDKSIRDYAAQTLKNIIKLEL